MYANTKKPTANGHEYKEEPQMNVNAHRSKTQEAARMSFRASGFRPMPLLSILASPDEQELVPSRTFIQAPSENYGSGEHTTVAAFLPWRGL